MNPRINNESVCSQFRSVPVEAHQYESVNVSEVKREWEAGGLDREKE